MSSIKTVGASGQISLGKKYAGCDVLIDNIESGVWVIKVGEFIPDNERWIHQSGPKKDLDKAISWAEKNPPVQTDIDELEKSLDP
jgi:hypothetical protein